MRLQFETGQPPLPAGREGSIWLDADGRVVGRAHIDRTCRWLVWDGLGTFRTAPGSPVVSVWPAAGAGDATVRIEFAHQIAPILKQAEDCEVLHASAALGPTGVVAFCGRSGAGKSTLAYAMRSVGWSQVADDHVIMSVNADGAIVQPYPFAPSFRAPSRTYFDATGLALSPRVAELPSRLAGVIILASRFDGPPGFEVSPVRAVETLEMLLPHAHCFDVHDPAECGRFVNHYMMLAARIPVFTLTFRPDFDRLPQIVLAVAALPDFAAEASATA